MNRKYSLKKSKDIDKLVKKKQSVGNKYYAIYYMNRMEKLPQIAVSPSKRFKTAVERNYQKRVTKEILRVDLSMIDYLKILIVVKTTVKDLTFIQKRNQLLYLIRKIKYEIENNKESK